MGKTEVRPAQRQQRVLGTVIRKPRTGSRVKARDDKKNKMSGFFPDFAGIPEGDLLFFLFFSARLPKGFAQQEFDLSVQRA
jgi:hypothetical protein